MSRHTDVIYDCIIKAMQDKSIVERNGCSDELLLIYQNKIDNLIREKDYVNRLMDQYYQMIIQDPIEATVEDDQTEISVSMQDWVESVLYEYEETLFTDAISAC